MRPSTPMVAVVVVLAAAVAFLLWERGNTDQANAANGTAINAAPSPRASGAADQPAETTHGAVDAGETGTQASTAGPLDTTLASPASGLGTPGAIERSILDFQYKALSPQASRLASSPKFDEYVANLQSQADSEAVTRMRAYRELFDETLAALPGGRSVDRLACGVNLCMASINAEKRWPDFSNWQLSLHQVSDLPMQATVAGQLDRPGGGVSYRLIFTTNREFSAIMGGPSGSP